MLCLKNVYEWDEKVSIKFICVKDECNLWSNWMMLWQDWIWKDVYAGALYNLLWNYMNGWGLTIYYKSCLLLIEFVWFGGTCKIEVMLMKSDWGGIWPN